MNRFTFDMKDRVWDGESYGLSSLAQQILDCAGGSGRIDEVCYTRYPRVDTVFSRAEDGSVQVTTIIPGGGPFSSEMPMPGKVHKLCVDFSEILLNPKEAAKKIQDHVALVKSDPACSEVLFKY